MTSLSDMRQADINRVKKAKEHLNDAVSILQKIKWENRTSLEDNFLFNVGESISDAQIYLDDILNIQK